MGNIIKLLDGQYLYMVDQNRIINSAIKDHFLAHAKDLTIPIKDLQIDEETLREKVQTLPMITLEVTQECNLRCKYCIYNNSYEHFRPFTSNRMTWETAKKAIDYVHRLVKNKGEKKFDVGFYGGEPLLNFPVIQNTVEYSKDTFKGWDLTFSMTSNLTVLTEESARYLAENNFLLTVSLDGNKENHDAKRVLANGKGTHDTVLKNLRLLKTIDSDYFQKKVSYTGVHSFDLPLADMKRFFDENECVKGQRLRVNNVNNVNTDYFERYPWDKQGKEREFQELEETIHTKLNNRETLTPFELYYSETAAMETESISSRSFTTAAQTCLYDSRVFVDAVGTFHICEKINNAFAIGNLNDGLDFRRMARILKQFTEVIKENCMTCDVKFLCTRCFCNFAGDGTFEIPADFCEGKRKSIVKNLERHIKYQEEGLIQ